jgi:diguanylate cyclase (GGDEF)-like protein/PAS domain S-box-containing protein
LVLNLSDISQLRALVVEDNIDDFTLLVDHLESYGVEILAERVDTEQTLTAALSQSWDIVFSDFSMPKMKGIRALEIVRSIDQDIPFIYLSGTIGETAAVKAIKAGAQDYVMKSDLARLVPTVERELQDAINRREQHRAEDMLRKMSLAIRQTADSVFITDASGHIEYVNPAFEVLTGYKLTEIIGKTPSLLRSNHHKDSEFKRLWQVISNGQTFTGILVNRRKDGTEFHEEKVISPLNNDKGEISHFVSTGRDMTSRVVAEMARKRFHSVLESTPDLVAIIRPDGAMLYLNRAGYEMLGLPANHGINGSTLWEIFPEPLTQQLRKQIFPTAVDEGHWTGEVWIEPESLNSPGLPVSLVVLAHTEEYTAIPYLSLIGRDISERKQFEARLQHQATHDGLTNLPNRYFLIDRLQASLHAARRRRKGVAVLFMDIDKFKQVNDNLGHVAGDELLQHVANRLQNCLRPSDTIARLGGDEFTVLIEDINRPDDAFVVLNKIFQTFKSPLQVESQELFVSLSMGIAIFPQDGNNALDLLRHADIAMYRAKHRGTNNQYQFYTPDMDTRGHEILQMDTDLRYAVDNKELCLFYQPQIDVQTARLVGVEALLRWLSPSRGLVSPADFVPLLESSGLIIGVGKWILEQACKQYQRFCTNGRPNIRISVNVSAVQFKDSAFKYMVAGAVEHFKIPPAALELEITENIVMQDPARAANVLVALNDIGVRTAIDDFGTGYSSLAYLKRFPVSTLKIDQSFMPDLLENASDAAIVEASITMAHKLGIEVVAEGVETEAQLDFLRQVNCDIAQGYWFSPPISQKNILSNGLNY